MEEQIVLFETAKLAQEKGFKSMDARTIITRSNYYNHLGVFRGDVTDLVRAQINEQDTTPFETIPAPTQSRLQKWLRETHDIHVQVLRLYTKEWKYVAEWGKQLPYLRGTLDPFDTYEEALEEALVQALNLIP